MEVFAPYALSVSSILLSIYTAYLRRKYGQPVALLPSGLRSEPVLAPQEDAIIWGEGQIESLLGEVGLTGENVTRMGPLSLMMAANQFSPKTAVIPEPVLAVVQGNKWDYWRTDWRKLPRRQM